MTVDVDFEGVIVLAIASNISTRNRKIAEVLKPRVAESISQAAASRIKRERAEHLGDVARQCIESGADVLEINLQQRYDNPEVMRFAVDAVQGVADCQLCLSSDRTDTLEAGLQACKRPPIINYVSLDGERLGEVLPLAARHGAEVIILAGAPTVPANAEDILKSAAVLVGAANESGISNDHIIVDPGLLHVTTDAGQRYVGMLLELLPALVEAFDAQVRTTCWINNASAGAPRRLRSYINNACLAMLAGVGLSSAFVDVLNKETMRTMRLIKILKNEAIYSDRDVE